jgi:predicted MFS family arabinose efflux permease
MDNTDLALVVVALAAGVVGGFVVWTYVQPMIAGRTALPAGTP